MSGSTSLADVLPAKVVDHDGDRWPWLVGRPEAVVHPESTEEVAATMRWAAARGVGVAVVASGRRFDGARAMDRPFLVLCTDRLVGIEIYEPADLTMTARAGTPLTTLTAKLAAERQWLPYDPPFFDDRTVGGLIATGESGPLWMGYGELRNHVLGATLVTGDGRVLRLGGRVVKNVAGFDLLKAVVGSRGRLGVITSACVRAFPMPLADRVLTLRGNSAADLVAVARSVGTAPVLPVSSVLVSPPLSAEAALLVRLHGAEPTVDADQKTLERHCGVSFERSEAAGASLASVRDYAADGETTLGLSTLPSRLGEALSNAKDALGDVPFVADTYSGTVRVALKATDVAAVGRLRARIESLGGALSARSKRRDLDAQGLGSQPSSAVTALTARLEKVFDPQGVLWPSKR
jgi:glycolate oxidase FAD binding subunit